MPRYPARVAVGSVGKLELYGSEKFVDPQSAADELLGFQEIAKGVRRKLNPPLHTRISRIISIESLVSGKLPNFYGIMQIRPHDSEAFLNSAKISFDDLKKLQSFKRTLKRMWLSFVDC